MKDKKRGGTAMKKKLTACVLVMALAFTMCVPAFAAEDARLQRAQLEIEQRVEAAMAAVESQMEDWDEGYKNVYREMITANIEHSVLQDGHKPVLTYTLMDSGMVQYEFTDSCGDTYRVAAVLLAEEDTEDLVYGIARAHVNEKRSSIRSLIAGLFPTIGDIAPFYSAPASALDRKTIADFDDAGRVAQLVSIVREGDDSTCDIVSGWHASTAFTAQEDAHYVLIQDF